MNGSHFASVQGIEMDRADAEDLLRTSGVGVLSLARGGEAYGVPISFGYDGERLYFLYVRGSDNSKKHRFSRETARASFLVYEVGDKHDWRSVVVSGPLERVSEDEWDALLDAVEDNAWFPSLFSEAEPVADFAGWALSVEEITGQQSG